MFLDEFLAMITAGALLPCLAAAARDWIRGRWLHH
ncbi:MAG: hypothetical protein RIR00_430 [Pseudomonadota bacterium]|jgi:hypothetical protein